MAYDEELTERVRDSLAGRPDIEEKRMFGGLTFMLAGNMCCGVHGSELILRLGPERAESALADTLRQADGLHRPADARLRHGLLGGTRR